MEKLPAFLLDVLGWAWCRAAIRCAECYHLPVGLGVEVDWALEWTEFGVLDFGRELGLRVVASIAACARVGLSCWISSSVLSLTATSTRRQTCSTLV